MIIETQNNHSWEVVMEHGINYLFLQTKKVGSSVPENSLKKLFCNEAGYCILLSKSWSPKWNVIALFLLLKHSSPKAMYFAERTAMEFCTERIYFGMWTFRWFKDMMWIHIIFSWRWTLYLPLCYEIIPLNSSTVFLLVVLLFWFEFCCLFVCLLFPFNRESKTKSIGWK